jgi:hypothetical protein
MHYRVPIGVAAMTAAQHAIKEGYYLSAERYQMPVRKGQAPPDLRYFKQPPK